MYFVNKSAGFTFPHTLRSSTAPDLVCCCTQSVWVSRWRILPRPLRPATPIAAELSVHTRHFTLITTSLTRAPTAEDFPQGTFPSEEAKANYTLVMSRFQKARQKEVPAGNAFGRAVRPPPPPRDARDARCANCTAMQCTLTPGVPTARRRKCHICVKTGRLARDCPEKAETAAKANVVTEPVPLPAPVEPPR
jgi:hypothetical protein